MCKLYLYWKVKFDMKITRLVYDSYVLFEEASPCLLDVYQVFIFYY
jgi:hypothetical protein